MTISTTESYRLNEADDVDLAVRRDRETGVFSVHRPDGGRLFEDRDIERVRSYLFGYRASHEETLAEFKAWVNSMPVLAHLPDGFRLQAHKNGAVIANDHSICALDSGFERSDDHWVPRRVFLAAWSAYHKLTYPFVQHALKVRSLDSRP